MIVETLCILAVLTGGCALVRTTGINGWPLPALGYVAGTSMQIIIGTIQAVSGLPTTPALTLALTLILPLAWWVACKIRGRHVSVKIIPTVITYLSVIIAVILLRSANLVNWHTDSFRYLMTGSLIYSGNYDAVSLNLIKLRLLSVPLIHAPANYSGEYYLRSAVPLLAVSTVAVFVWLCREGLRDKLNQRQVALFSTAGVLLLTTNNRFVWNAFYINGHLFVAVLLMLIAGCCWLLVRGTNVPRCALLTLTLLAIPALVVTRPEGLLVAGLALLPALVSESIPWRQRAIILLTLGISILVWEGFSVFAYIKRGTDIPFSASGLLGLGILAVITVPLLAWRRLDKPLRYFPIVVEIALWAALIIAAVREPFILRQSLLVTVENVVYNAGSWGCSLIVLGVIFLGIIVLTNYSDRIFLRFPVTTFIPFSFLLAYLRDNPYRVGNGDSLNRMFIHIVPLAILFIITAAGSERWGLPDCLRTPYLYLKKRFG